MRITKENIREKQENAPFLKDLVVDDDNNGFYRKITDIDPKNPYAGKFTIKYKGSIWFVKYSKEEKVWFLMYEKII